MPVDLLHPNETTSGTDQSTTTLVAGIVKDAQELFKQQVRLLQLEAEEDLRLTTQAAISLVIGMATALVGAVMLTLGAVHLLNHLMPDTPLWVWYAVIGVIVAGVGGVLVAGALTAFNKINPLPESTEAMKETLEWQTKPK